MPVVTEGAFDAIAVTLAGDGHTVGVAPCGTALTAAQVQLLADAGVTTVLDAADTDTAGRAAMLRHHGLYVEAGIQAHQLMLIPPAGQPPVKDPAELFYRDNGHTLRQCLDLGTDSPTLAGQVISTTVFQNVDRIRENILIATAVADRLADVIAALPVEQWEDHTRLAADLIADAHPSDGYYHELVDQILDQVAATHATTRTLPAPKDPAMTPGTQIDPAILARMQALSASTDKALADLSTTAQQTQRAEQVGLTLAERMERLEQMRQHLHQAEQEFKRRTNDIDHQMPVDTDTIDPARDMLD